MTRCITVYYCTAAPVYIHIHIFGWRVLQKEIFNKGKGYET